MLTMFHPREDLSLSSSIALQFIGNNHTWDVLQSFEERGAKTLLAACLLRRLCDPYIKHIPILIHRSPEGVSFATNG